MFRKAQDRARDVARFVAHAFKVDADARAPEKTAKVDRLGLTDGDLVFDLGVDFHVLSVDDGVAVAHLFGEGDVELDEGLAGLLELRGNRRPHRVDELRHLIEVTVKTLENMSAHFSSTP